MRSFVLGLFAVTAIAATTLLHPTVEDGVGAWTTLGMDGVVRAAREPADERQAKPSLAFDYEIGPKKFGAAILPVEPGTLTGMDQIHFWVKTDYPTTVGVTLSEKGGGNYSAVAWSPGNVWQEVRVEPHDFTLGERGNDPPDPDGKLDVDQVHAVGVADLGQLFGAAQPNPPTPIVLSRHPGKHTLLVSDFEALSGSARVTDKLLIDSFEAPQVTWFSPGGATFRIDDSREHAPGPAMEVAYEQDNGVVLFARNLPPDIPPNITHISFDIASEKPAEFIFALQQHGTGSGEGPRFNTTVEVRGGGKSDHRDLAISAFNPDQNGPPDSGGGLLVSKSKTLSIGDISAATTGAHGSNKVWISNLRLTARE